MTASCSSTFLVGRIPSCCCTAFVTTYRRHEEALLHSVAYALQNGIVLFADLWSKELHTTQQQTETDYSYLVDTRQQWATMNTV